MTIDQNKELVRKIKTLCKESKNGTAMYIVPLQPGPSSICAFHDQMTDKMVVTVSENIIDFGKLGKSSGLDVIKQLFVGDRPHAEYTLYEMDLEGELVGGGMIQHARPDCPNPDPDDDVWPLIEGDQVLVDEMKRDLRLILSETLEHGKVIPQRLQGTYDAVEYFSGNIPRVER
jgi:hypothetical protein